MEGGGGGRRGRVSEKALRPSGRANAQLSAFGNRLLVVFVVDVEGVVRDGIRIFDWNPRNVQWDRF